MTFNRTVGYSAPGQQYMLVIDGSAPIPLQSLSISQNEPQGGGLLAPPRETVVEATTQSGGLQAAASHQAMRDTIDWLQTQIFDLRSWLSGVQPVEDPDVPGRYYCAVCGHVRPAHLHGCPAAPD